MTLVAEWLLATVVAARRAALVRCPQCGKRFHCHGDGWYLASPFFFLDRQCCHCGFCAPKKS